MSIMTAIYTTFNRSKRQIRLVKGPREGSCDDEIDCELAIVSLNINPTFEVATTLDSHPPTSPLLQCSYIVGAVVMFGALKRILSSFG